MIGNKKKAAQREPLCDLTMIVLLFTTNYVVTSA